MQSETVVHQIGRVKVKLHYAIQLASWSQACLRSASELDSVMEFGLSGALQLASSSLAAS